MPWSKIRRMAAGLAAGAAMAGGCVWAEDPPLPPPRPVAVAPPLAAQAEGAERLLPIDLPYALRLVGAANPTIAMARARVREAYEAQRLAGLLWVPNLWVGGNPEAPTFLPAFYHHDGLIQNSHGQVFFTDRNDFFLMAGASLQVSLADAVYGPRIARRGTEAQAARERAVVNDIQLDVALAYLDLLRAYGALAINADAIRMAAEVYRVADRAFKQGLGKTAADADRARSELELRRTERFTLQGDAAGASARLAQLLLLDSAADLVPGDQGVLPIMLISADQPIDNMIADGLMNRPELAESRALVEQALERWRLERHRPLIPTLQAFYYGGSFVGGNPQLNTAGGREDFLGQVSWELKNLGLGNIHAARERRAGYDAARYHLIEVQAQVGAEVTAAAKLVRLRQRALANAQEAVRSGQAMWTKLLAARFEITGRPGDPIRYDFLEPLLAEQELTRARQEYLFQVIEYDRNQFRLYWAMGQPPACSLPDSKALPTDTPVVPPPAEH
jgi:outer membrane protein TolC